MPSDNGPRCVDMPMVESWGVLASDDTFSLPEDEQCFTADVLANDLEIDGDSLNVVLTSYSVPGQLWILSGGYFQYIPPQSSAPKRIQDELAASVSSSATASYIGTVEEAVSGSCELQLAAGLSHHPFALTVVSNKRWPFSRWSIRRGSWSVESRVLLSLPWACRTARDSLGSQHRAAGRARQ